MTLVVQWWFFVPFGKRGRVLHPLPVNHPQCPFIQMTDTDVIFLSCYNTVGHTRMYVMTLTSPPTLPLSRPWAGLSMRRFMPSHLLIQGSSLLSFLPYSPSVFWMFKISTLSVSTCLPTVTRILPGHTSHYPCLLSTLISLPPLWSLPDPKIPLKTILQDGT
jgi:hypothetical protein